MVRAACQGQPDGETDLDQWAGSADHDPEHKIKLVVDEWGSWHPAGTEINPNHLFEQMGTLRDALVAALSLDTFNRHAEKVEMANVAQLVNNLHSLFLADGDRFVATPNFHVFEMYRPHHGAKSVRIDVQAPPVGFRGPGKAGRLFRIAGSASRSNGRDLTVTLVQPRQRACRGGHSPPGRLRGNGPADGARTQGTERP